jgi:hypothetical protein
MPGRRVDGKISAFLFDTLITIRAVFHVGDAWFYIKEHL